MVEQFAAGDALVSLRSRAAAFRPLTVVREMEADAQKQYFGRMKTLEDELQKTTDKLQELQKARGGDAKGAQILSPEQQAEIEKLPQARGRDAPGAEGTAQEPAPGRRGLVFWTKVANIALMPLLVVLLGLGVFFLKRRRQSPAA